MADSHEFGRRGEQLAASYLEGRGWRVIERNWRYHHKEIDLVARHGQEVAFVEVKTRGPRSWGHPLEAITAAKRRELRIAALGWITLRGRPGEVYRFDAVVVERDAAGTRVEHVEGAWQL